MQTRLLDLVADLIAPEDQSRLRSRIDLFIESLRATLLKATDSQNQADINELGHALGIAPYSFIVEYEDHIGYHKQHPQFFITEQQVQLAYEKECQNWKMKRFPIADSATAWRITLAKDLVTIATNSDGIFTL